MAQIFNKFKKVCKDTESLETEDVVLCIAMSDEGDGITHKYAKETGDLATLVFNALLNDPELFVATAAAIDKLRENNFKDINAN